MADDNNLSFILDLDNSEFIKGLSDAKDSVADLGETGGDSLSGLLDSFTAIAEELAPLAVAAFAFKESLDLTLEGEQIERVEKSFESLSIQAGISGIALKNALVQSANGLVSENDLLQEANKFIVQMGGSAAQLPQIMQLAQKATAVFGGDVKTNFDNIATAIGNGNVRMLKHYGIIVDADKAYQKYAASIGVAVDSLSEEGKRQAIMNEALAQGEARFKGIVGNAGQATTAVQAMKVAWTELSETISVIASKALAPFFKSVFNGVAEVSRELKDKFVSAFGEGSQKSAAEIKNLERELAQLKLTLKQTLDMKAHGMGGDAFVEATYAKRIADTEAKLNQLKGKYQEAGQEAKKQEEEALKDQAAASGETQKQRSVDHQKEAADEAKFQKDMEKFQSDRLKAEENNIQSFAQIENQIRVENEEAEREHSTKIKEIQNAKYLNARQKEQEIAAANTTFQAQIQANEEKTAKLRQKLLDQYQKNSKTAFEGIGRAFQVNSMKNAAELSDFGKLGQTTFNAFSSNAVSNLEAIGNGSKSATDAMKDFFLGALGDIAEKQGEVMLLSGIFPPNPAVLAAGAALIVLGGYLKGQAGGGSSSGSSISSGGGAALPSASSSDTSSGVTSPTDAQNTTATAASQAQATPQKTVNINIAGNYMDTDTTRRQLMELVRQESDATNFNYNTAGGNA